MRILFKLIMPVSALLTTYYVNDIRFRISSKGFFFFAVASNCVKIADSKPSAMCLAPCAISLVGRYQIYLCERGRKC